MPGISKDYYTISPADVYPGGLSPDLKDYEGKLNDKGNIDSDYDYCEQKHISKHKQSHRDHDVRFYDGSNNNSSYEHPEHIRSDHKHSNSKYEHVRSDSVHEHKHSNSIHEHIHSDSTLEHDYSKYHSESRDVISKQHQLFH